MWNEVGKDELYAKESKASRVGILVILFPSFFTCEVPIVVNNRVVHTRDALAA